VSAGDATARTLKLASGVSVRQIRSGDDAPPMCEVLHDGAATGTRLHGAILEAAVAWNTCVVIFLTDDIPAEDALHIYLLDATFQLLDSASLSARYTTGSCAALRLMPPDHLSFRFFGDSEWRVELLAQAKVRVPFFSEPAGVHRPLGFSRRFIVRSD
jgi:hypothetical protein